MGDSSEPNTDMKYKIETLYMEKEKYEFYNDGILMIVFNPEIWYTYFLSPFYWKIDHENEGCAFWLKITVNLTF